MSWIEVAAPTQLAVSLADAKTACRVTDNTEDAYITLLVKAATRVIEAKTRRVFIRRSFKVYADDFPDEYGMEIPIAPLVSVTAMRYYDQAGSFSTLDPDSYDVDTKGLLARVRNSAFSLWPYVNPQFNAVEVEFIAGYSTTEAGVPEEMKAAILFLTAHFYANREPVAVGTAVLANKIPFTLEYVINSFKIMSV